MLWVICLNQHFFWNEIKCRKKPIYIFGGKAWALVNCHRSIDCSRTSAGSDQLQLSLGKRRAWLLLTSAASVFVCAFRNKAHLKVKSWLATRQLPEKDNRVSFQTNYLCDGGESCSGHFPSLWLSKKGASNICQMKQHLGDRN